MKPKRTLIEAVQSSRPVCGAGLALSGFLLFMSVLGFFVPSDPLSGTWTISMNTGTDVLWGIFFSALAALAVYLITFFWEPFRRR